MKLLSKKIIIICATIFIVVISLIAFSYFYFKPINYDYNIVNSEKNTLVLKNKFLKCSVTSKIKVNNNTKIISDYLIKDGYKNDNNYYTKNYVIKGVCKKNIKKYSLKKNDFKLKGKKEFELELKSEYKDLGYDSKKNIKVEVINNINNEKIGINYVIYKINNGLLNKYELRKVIVVDKIKPEIELSGKSEIILYLNNQYKEPGYKAIDNYDGDVTSNVIVQGEIDNKKIGEYLLTYTVKDSSGNENSVQRKITVKEKPVISSPAPSIGTVDGLTFINGILIVNKKYGLPSDYNPGVNPVALDALQRMQSDARNVGLNLRLVSGFRSYETQRTIYNNYVRMYGESYASSISAYPGHSEHQTGLAFDIGSTKASFANTAEAKWLNDNAHLYGFIIRYPKDKTYITGYVYEPWHIRYLGVDIATNIKQRNITLEEYLGVN